MARARAWQWGTRWLDASQKTFGLKNGQDSVIGWRVERGEKRIVLEDDNVIYLRKEGEVEKEKVNVVDKIEVYLLNAQGTRCEREGRGLPPLHHFTLGVGGSPRSGLGQGARVIGRASAPGGHQTPLLPLP